MHVVVCERAARDDEVQLVLVETRLLHVDVGPDLRHPDREVVALQNRELAAEDGLGLGQVGTEEAV